MANEIAKFKFDAKSNYSGYQTAVEKLRNEFGQTSGWTYGENDGSIFGSASFYLISIKSDIKDAGKAGNICRAYGGEPYL